MQLRPYQKELLEKTKHHKAYCNTFSTGAGKTFTTIQSYNQNPTTNLLIITPNNVVRQWGIELKKYSTKPVNQFEIKKSDTIDKINKRLKAEKGTYNVVILNYEKITKMTYLESMLDKSWTVILDESHRINNWGNITRKQRATLRKKMHLQIAENTTRSIVRLGALVDFKYLLTATPVEGKYGGYIGYYPLIKFMGYTNMSYEDYCDRYVKFTAINYGNSKYPVNVISGYRNVERLESNLEKIFFGYNAKYGDYEPVHHDIRLERTKNYNQIVDENVYNDIMIENSVQKRILKKYITGGKVVGKDLFGMEYTYIDNTIKIDWLEDFLQDVDGKVVIFYQYNVELDMIETLLNKMKKNYSVINGKTKDKHHEIYGKEWEVLVGQYQAAGTGTDGLQYFSNHMVMYSLPESSRDYIQAIGRIDRLGQEKVPNYYYLIMEKTIDSLTKMMIDSKMEFTEATLARFELDIMEEQQ